MLSQNGWSVFSSPPSGLLKWVTGRIRPGDVQTVFDYLCFRLNYIETNKKSWSWGWAYRPIRGQVNGFSNHASATAIDYNAPAHPLGVTGTWSADEIRMIHNILEDLEGVVRWGEDYQNRKDGMHFEIDDDAAAVARVAYKIRHGQLPGLKPDWEPKDAKAVHFGRTQEQFLIAAGVEKGEIVKLNGVGLIQKALNKVLQGEDLVVDGLAGEATLNAWGRWERIAGLHGRPRIPDRHSVEELAKKAGIRITGKTWES